MKKYLKILLLLKKSGYLLIFSSVDLGSGSGSGSDQNKMYPKHCPKTILTSTYYLLLFEELCAVMCSLISHGTEGGGSNLCPEIATKTAM